MNLNPRQKAFFLMVLCIDAKKAPLYFPYLSAVEQEAMEKMLQALPQDQPTQVADVARDQLKRLARPQRRSFLSDVHNDWILDVLKHETPHMVAAILRHLPPERVSVLLDELPPSLLNNLPRLSETYTMPKAFSEHLRLKFQELFLLPRDINFKQEFSFDKLPYLSAHQLELVFQELGYREIALGLAALPQSTRQAVSARLSSEDRLCVERYMKTAMQASPQRIKKAQFHLVSKDVNPEDHRYFVKELGYLLYAKSLMATDLSDLDIVYKKISMREAEILKSMIEQYVQKNTEATVVGFREDILAAVKFVREGLK
jgi:hypothetical protein